MRRARTAGSTLALAALAFAALAAFGPTLACGGKVDLGTSGPGSSGASSGGAGGDPTDTAVPNPTAAPPTPLPPPSPELCEGSKTAPSGGACDPSRLRVGGRGKARPCFGIGQFCDFILVRLREEEAKLLPPEFRCDRPVGGAVSCRLELDGDRRVDADVLDAACAATVASGTAFVDCVVLD